MSDQTATNRLINAEPDNQPTDSDAKAAALDQAQDERTRQQYGDLPHLDAVVANAVAEGGAVPTAIDHRGPLPEQAGHGVVFPARPAPPPRGFWSQASYYIIAMRDIMASSVGMAVTGGTMDASAVTADSNGDKIVYEGTVLEASSTKLKPRTTGTAKGILLRRINLRDADVDVGVVVGGWVREDKCWDNGVFGTVESGSKTDLTAIYFVTTDL